MEELLKETIHKKFIDKMIKIAVKEVLKKTERL